MWRKVIIWRVTSFTIAGGISYLYLGEWQKSLTLTAILTVTMTIVHYGFERAWEHRNPPGGGRV